MRINNNLMAMNTHRQLGINNNTTSKSVEKLSSGLRINRAGDDSAGLAISEKMRGQIRGLNQSSRNAQDAISLVQTAEGALNESHSILQRMRELSVQSSTDSNVDVDRTALQNEVNELVGELTSISENTEFNTQKLLNGEFSGKFQIGANEGQSMELKVGDMSAEALELTGSGGGGGESEGTFELAAASSFRSVYSDINLVGLVLGENVLDVVEIDNITVDPVPPIVVANYGLANSDGKIVAVSEDAQQFRLLNGEYEVNDLEGAFVDNNGFMKFNETVKTGTVTLDADASSNMTNIIASAASVEVEGLATGDYSVKVEGTTSDYEQYFGGITFDTIHTTSDHMTGVLLNEDDEAVAVKFASGVTGADFKEWFLVSDLTTELGGAADAAGDLDVSAADPIMTSEYLVDGHVLSIEAETGAQVSKGIDISTQETASEAITTINNAIETVSTQRSKLGAVQNRLDHTIKNLDTSAENLQASESRIRDVDMASEMMKFTKNNILQQAAQSMLAQANSQPQGILQLIR